MRTISKKQTCEKVGASATTIWRWVKDAGFPEPIQLGPNRIAWIEDEVDDWIKSRPRGSIKASPTRADGQQAYIAARTESGLPRREFDALRKSEQREGV